MPITFNKKTMICELNQLLINGEKYISRCWGTISRFPLLLSTYCTDNDSSKKYIGFKNIYAYIGLTNHHLNIVTLHSLDVTRITGHYSIPLGNMQNKKSEFGYLKSFITFNIQSSAIKILFLNSSSGSDINNQRQNVKLLCKHLTD